jgi:predicted MFS family arabinose efflux permease
LAISLFSVGRLVGAPVLGWWYNKRSALEVLTVALIIGVGGNIMFSFASVSGIYLLLVSRIIIGFSTGILLFSYILIILISLFTCFISNFLFFYYNNY